MIVEEINPGVHVLYQEHYQLDGEEGDEAGVYVCGKIVEKQFYPPLLIQLFAWMESHHLNKEAKCFTPLHIMELR